MASDKDLSDSVILQEFRARDFVDKAKSMLAYLKEHAEEINEDPAALIAAADKYCYEKDRRMMHVGDKKGKTLPWPVNAEWTALVSTVFNPRTYL